MSLIDWLRHDTYVGQIVGEQQTGKSYLLTVLSYCMACGRSYGPFDIPKPRKVIYLNVEDPKDQINYRCKNVMLKLDFTDEEHALFAENLLILPWVGQFGTINNKAGDNDEVKILEKMITDFHPDLIIADTKSRLSTGDENSNASQAELVRILESLTVKYQGPFLMAHHPTKSNPKSSRGAGSWESNIRLSINLIKMDKKTAALFNFSPQEAHNCAFIMSCNDNYGGQNTAYFYKDKETGLPYPINPDNNNLELVQKWILGCLAKHTEVNKRNLTQLRSKDDPVVAEMLESFPEIKGGKKYVVEDAVTSLVDAKRIFETKTGKSINLTKKRPKTEILQFPTRNNPKK
jgi:RecA-family ATPase